MASALRQILRKQSATSIISAFNKPYYCNPNVALPFSNYLSNEPCFVDNNNNISYLPQKSTLSLASLDPSNAQDYRPSPSIPIFPMLPFAFSLHSIPPPVSGMLLSESEVVSGDETKIWADSVKKKRKKKMNKHKYRKLRKRLSRQT